MSPEIFTKSPVDKAIKSIKRKEKKEQKINDYYTKLLSGEIPID